MPKYIALLRTSVVAGIIAAAIVIGSVSYFVLDSYEQRAVTSRYDNIADFAMSALDGEFSEKKSAVLMLAKAAGYHFPNETIWPNVRMNEFFDITASLRDATALGDLFLAPLVVPGKLPAFNSFYREYIDSDPDIPADAGIPGLDVWGLNGDDVFPETTGEALNYHSPNRIMTPLIQFLFDGDFNEQYFGLNLHSLIEFGQSMDSAIECSRQHNYTTATKHCTNISTVTPLPLNVPDSQVTSFHASIIQPIYLNQNSSTLVGFAGAGFDWRALLSPLFATSTGGVDVVIINNDVKFTLTTARGGLKVKGFGDLHDSRYNAYRREKTLFASEDGTDNASTYKVFVYPSHYFFDTYTTSTPILAAIGSSLLLILCGASFYLYDHFTRKAAAANAAVLETKRRFVRFISHEIRTPLNAVHLGLEALTSEVGRAIEQMFSSSKDGPACDSDAFLQTLRSWLDLSTEMMGNSESAVDVLNDLLNYDKIEMGTLRLEFSSVAIWSVVQSVTVSFLTPAKQKNIHVTLDTDIAARNENFAERLQDMFVVVGDSARLSQVMRNLISNSIKFTPEGGFISIQGERVSDSMLCPLL